MVDMKFREWASERFEKENKGNGLTMSADFPDGVKDRVTSRLDAVIGEGYCEELDLWQQRNQYNDKLDDLEWLMTGGEDGIKLSELEKNINKRRQEIEALEAKYADRQDAIAKEKIKRKKDKLDELKKQYKRKCQKMLDYPQGRTRLFTTVTEEEAELFDYLLDFLPSEKGENCETMNRLTLAQKNLWEQIPFAERWKLLELMARALDSEGELFVTDKCWEDVKYKLKYPQCYRIKCNLDVLYDFAEDAELCSTETRVFLEKLEKVTASLKKDCQKEAEEGNEVDESILWKQIEKYLNEK
jgi:hypothetical protein